MSNGQGVAGFALLLASAGVAAGAAPPAKGSPLAFVDGIYRPWEAADRASKGAGGYQPDGTAVYAPPLARLLARDGAIAEREGGPNLIDYVILCSCQDDGGIRARPTLVSTTSSAATVRVQLSFAGGNATALLLELARTPVGWRIADVQTRETPSLVAYLRDGLK